MWSKVRNSLGDETDTGRRDRHCVTDVTAQLLTLREKKNGPWPFVSRSPTLGHWNCYPAYCPTGHKFVCFVFVFLSENNNNNNNNNIFSADL